MEYGLGLSTKQLESLLETVLILVVMEYGLGHRGICSRHAGCGVLILVVMEYGLGLHRRSRH